MAHKRAELEASKEQYNYNTAMARLKVLEEALSASEKDSTISSIVEVGNSIKHTKDYVLNKGSVHLAAHNAPGLPETSSYQAKEVPATPYTQNIRSMLPAHLYNTSEYIKEHQAKPQASDQTPYNVIVPEKHVIKTTDNN